MRSLITVLLACFYLYAGIVFADDKAKPQQKLITAGWLESVVLQPWGVRMRAKLDTGAKTSSLHAINIEQFERNGNKWVRFNTNAHNDDSNLLTIEARMVREVKIKDHALKAAIRPVIEVRFCLKNRLFTSEFGLIDRGPFNYPVLLGRTMLQQGIIIDPAMTFTSRTSKKQCKKLIEMGRKSID